MTFIRLLWIFFGVSAGVVVASRHQSMDDGLCVH